MEISDDNVHSTLSVGDELFPKTDWTRKYTVGPNYVYVEWTHKTLYAVATANRIILCDADMAGLKNYFDDENIALIFSNYDTYEPRTSCTSQDLLLYEYDTTDEGREYDAHIWAKPLEAPNHLLWVMLVFPKEDSQMMQEYGGKLFPEMVFCH